MKKAKRFRVKLPKIFKQRLLKNYVRSNSSVLLLLMGALSVFGVLILVPAHGQSEAEWAAVAPHLRFRESGNDYANYDTGGNDVYGAYQFDQPTWDSTAKAAGRPKLVGVNPANASPADQDLLAHQLYMDRCDTPQHCYYAWEAWPKAVADSNNPNAPIKADGCYGDGSCGGGAPSGPVPAAPVASQSVDCSTVVLKQGSTGPCVVELQNKLNAAGYNVGDADGAFGAKTKEGVQHFQHDNTIGNSGCVQSDNTFFDQIFWYTCDGVVGNSTHTALDNADTRPDASTRQGCQALGMSNCDSLGDYPITYDSCRAQYYNCATIDLSTLSNNNTPPTCQYLDHPEYCDLYGAGSGDTGLVNGTGGASTTGQYPIDGGYCTVTGCYVVPPGQTNSVSAGPDCNNDPNLEYCVNNGITSNVAGANYENSYTQTCQYTDHPEYCDTYGAGLPQPTIDTGSNEPTYNTPISAGPDCNNDPTLEYCQNNGITSNVGESSYESSYTQTCEYTDHPEYCDTYGAGNGGEPGYEGSYEPTYNTPISAGPDCNNDPTLEYCQNNGITSNEPGYENSYETGYAGQCEYTDHPEYCDTYGAGNGGEPGYEGSYEPNYEPAYEGGYEVGYEGSYIGECEYTDHPEYCL